MIIARMEIKNFKSFGESKIVTFEPMTALVGENNAGKSNIVQAIDLFRAYCRTKICRNTFYARNLWQPIEIRVTFGSLSPAECSLFRRHLSSDETLTIVQRIWANEQLQKVAAESSQPPAEHPEDSSPNQPDSPSGDGNGVASLSDKQKQEIELDPVEEKTAEIVVSDIEWLNTPPSTKRDIEKLWKQSTLMVGDIDFKAWSGLSIDSSPDKEQLTQRISDFWDEHWDDIPKQAEGSGTHPLGWPAKLMANLPDVVHVAAAKKIEEETRSAKTSPFGALLTWMVKSIQADLRQQVQTGLTKVFSEALANLPKDMKDEQTGEDVTRLELINRTLNAYVLGDFGCQLAVEFEEPEVDSTIFGSPVLKADDGFQTDISDKGHGLQRATMLTIVRAYLSLRSQLDAKSPGLGRVIFLIEEPEIYLHPTLRRSAYGLFRALSENGDQVIYTTHDGYMLNVLHFDEVRVIRREREVQPAPVTCVDAVSAGVLLEVWHRLTGIDKIPIESIRARLYKAYDPYRNEGFLSSKVLLCEGDTERLALPIYFRALGFDLDEHGIALIAAGSVDLLDYFYLMFTEMGIPTYLIWDSDTPDESDVSSVTNQTRRRDILGKSKRNHQLAQLVGAAIAAREDGCCFCTGETITDRAAVFPRKYEQSMMGTLSDSEAVKGQATRLYGSDSKPLMARYYAVEAVERGTAEGDPGKYVPDFVKQVKSRLEILGVPEKQSVILGIRDMC